MKKINLRELYPDVYTTDFFVDVTEEVMETIRAAERAETAYERKVSRYKAQYSLDCENGLENAVLLKPHMPEMLLEEKQLQEQVYSAVMNLPKKQAHQMKFYQKYFTSCFNPRRILSRTRLGSTPSTSAISFTFIPR